MFHERHLINKYMKILIKKKSKFGPEMPPECIYSLHFFKIFRGACPRTPLQRLRAFGTRRRAPSAHGSRIRTMSFSSKKIFSKFVFNPLLSLSITPLHFAIHTIRLAFQ